MRWLVVWLSFFSLLCVPSVQASGTVAGFWYAVLVDEKRGHSATEYIGWLDKETYSQIVSGKNSNAFFTLKKAFWVNGDGGVSDFVAERRDRRLYGYQADVQFRYQSVLRVIKLDQNIAEGHRDLLRFQAQRRK